MIYFVIAMEYPRHFNKEIRDRLKKSGVALIYLYGSEAIRRSNLLSDIDIGIVLSNPQRMLRDRKARYPLRSQLTDLLEPIFTPNHSREIDLVFLQTASPILQFEAINAGCPLFAADPIFQADYEAAVTQAYLDVRPLVETHFQAALERAA